LIEDVTLLNHDLDYSWINLIFLKMFYSLFVISIFIVLIDLEDISKLLFSVIEIEYCEIDFVNISDLVLQS